MNIKILDSWLRDYIKTTATPQKIAEILSLTSVSVERLEKYKSDWVYDIEVTTNRPELMSVVSIAREAATVLPLSGITATFKEPKLDLPKITIKNPPPITFKNDPKLVHRICAVIMEVTLKDSPQVFKDRLESSGIRSLNNVIDVTNYVMREIGHPTHVFDYDRLTTHTLHIRESKKGEKIKTLDEKIFTLSGGDIVADNGKGEIVDLLGVMGTANSVVTKDTKRILFFIDSVNPRHIRKTSMEHGIRSEAAILNEKGINSEYATDALARGIALFQQIANAKIISNIIDIYLIHPKPTKISVTEEKINHLVGVTIPLKTSIEILTKLGFSVKQNGASLEVTVPAKKNGDDMQIPEDLIEEIARVYGYHNIPNKLPHITNNTYLPIEKNIFYWEDRMKDAMMYWGFTEVYTYPMVSKNLFNGTDAIAVTIQNPLTEEFVYMRTSLFPSLLQVVKENQDYETVKLFEIANVYEKQGKQLPKQTMKFAGLIQKPKVSFYEVKGIVEQLLNDVGITDAQFKLLNSDSYGALISIGKEELGIIEIRNDSMICWELDMTTILHHVKLKRSYKPISKYPASFEDMAIIAPDNISTGDLMETIKNQSALIAEVSLLDKYAQTRTFHIVYQSYQKNLTADDLTPIREKIIKSLQEKHGARLK
jgi:phenylalanyl-tRNA synthetase beta chain